MSRFPYIKKEWWKNFFDRIYLITDARSVCNPSLTRKETGFLEQILKLDKNDRILDLCGGHGRHSLELARRGYRYLTVLDYSRFLIDRGRRLAQRAGYNIKFICGDARSSRLKSETYSVVFIMANSFGYFSDDRENFRILKEAHRLLLRGGRLLLDLTDPDYVKRTLRKLSWHEASKDIIVCRERDLKDGLIMAREIVISKKKGLVKDGYYCERLYGRKKIICLLKHAGFKNISIKKGVKLHETKGDYGFLTSRMIVTAVKF